MKQNAFTKDLKQITSDDYYEVTKSLRVSHDQVDKVELIIKKYGLSGWSEAIRKLINEAV